MRTSINIARTELRTFFFSPIAWLVLVIFTFQCALNVTDILARISADINAGMWAFNLTGGVLANFDGAFALVQKTVYLYLPLLTMGLISREISSGSIKLIFSSPVTAWQLVAGKYMAMVAYCLTMSLITIIAAIPAMMTLSNFDCGLLLGGVASTFLLIATYAAIGLFMSCLTSYQVVAAISTMVLLGGLNYIGEVGKGVDVVRDITGFLSVAGRGETLREGLFLTSDLAYFLILITFFLTISVQYLNAQQRAVPFTRKVMKAVLLTGTLGLIGWVTSHPVFTGYLDLTKTRQRTLTEIAKQALPAHHIPMKVTTYVNILDENFWRYTSPEKRREDRAFWAPYIRFKPDIQFQYVYYYGKLNSPGLYAANPKKTDRQIAEKIAEAYGISMDRILPADRLPDAALLEKEGNRTVRILSAGGRQVALRFFDFDMDANPYETEITDALNLLKEPPVQVALLDGEAERGFSKEGDRDYQLFLTSLNTRMALVNHGFAFRAIKAEDAVPADVDLLVIADPRTPLSPEKSAHLLDYISSGRNLLVMGEPGKAGIINPILAPLGIGMRPGLVVQRSKDYSPAFIREKIQAGGRLLGFAGLEGGIGGDVTSSSVGALDLKGSGTFSAFPLLCNMPEVSWYRDNGLLPDTGQVVFNPSYGDRKGTVVTAYGLKRPVKGRPEQRVIVMADADWLTQAEYYRPAPGIRYSVGLMDAVFKYLGNGRYPREITRPQPPDNKIIADKRSILNFRIIFLGVLPGLLLVAGSILLLRRRAR